VPDSQPGASWQAHVASWILRHTLKPRLHRARTIGEVRRLLTPPPFHVPRKIKIEPATIGGVPGEWVTGPNPAPITLLYIHGGGYFACSAKTHRPITVAYALGGFRVYAPDYRLAPEHPFPAAVDDALAVYRVLAGETSPLVLSGESAGGGLALALMLAARDAALPLPAAAALFSPWTDLAATGDSIRTNDRSCAMFHGEPIAREARRYLNGADPRNPLASPLYADLRNLPPLLIHASRDEVLRDDSIRFAERARAAGVSVDLKIWPVVSHAWQLSQFFVPEARQSLREASAFLRAAVAARPEQPAGGVHS
jgi:monoterpene epsilon-lactone hydrolase